MALSPFGFELSEHLLGPLPRTLDSAESLGVAKQLGADPLQKGLLTANHCLSFSSSAFST